MNNRNVASGCGLRIAPSTMNLGELTTVEDVVLLISASYLESAAVQNERTLLRAAALPKQPGDDLLRPAISKAETDPDRLLRLNS